MLSRTIDIVLLVMNLAAAIFYVVLFGLIIYLDLLTARETETTQSYSVNPWTPAYYLSSFLLIFYLVLSTANIVNIHTIGRMRKGMAMTSGVSRKSYIVSIILLVPIGTTYLVLDILVMSAPASRSLFLPCNFPIIVLSIMVVYNTLEIVLLGRGILNVGKEKRRLGNLEEAGEMNMMGSTYQRFRDG